MKIIPHSNILIDGRHAPAGQPHATSDVIARALIAQGLAKAAPVPAAEPVKTAQVPPPPTVETAEAAPAAETAAARPVRKAKA